MVLSGASTMHGYNSLHIELDSLVIAYVLMSNKMKLEHIVARITNLLKGTNHHFSHCFREANQVTTWFLWVLKLYTFFVLLLYGWDI